MLPVQLRNKKIKHKRIFSRKFQLMMNTLQLMISPFQLMISKIRSLITKGMLICELANNAWNDELGYFYCHIYVFYCHIYVFLLPYIILYMCVQIDILFPTADPVY